MNSRIPSKYWSLVTPSFLGKVPLGAAGIPERFKSSRYSILVEQRIESHSKMLFVRQRHQEIVDKDVRAFRFISADYAANLCDMTPELPPRNEISRKRR